MSRMIRTISLSTMMLALAGSVSAKPAPKPPVDIAAAVAGIYSGAVISDSKGSSRDGVTLTLTRSAPNTVTITSDYPRLPVVTVRLTNAMGKIVQATGNTAFFLDRAKQPPALDVSFNNEVSWSGTKQ